VYRRCTAKTTRHCSPVPCEVACHRFSRLKFLRGRQQEPCGWNRVLLEVQDLPARIADLKEAGLRFRNEVEVGPGGKQIQIEDSDGNPIELFEPARRWKMDDERVTRISRPAAVKYAARHHED